ncbi:hypothetical protein AQPE_2932 [Aquipluma nitroreducens]|uniref:Uncharacterized protein n=1 Tax=Aquipluma nitroreducens TaxID=2010828 RepID=A0A5K7SBE6_9BACT|nr:hypothetical protein AQPE_2932 [Aquipluma nitroreducens]
MTPIVKLVSIFHWAVSDVGRQKINNKINKIGFLMAIG